MSARYSTADLIEAARRDGCCPKFAARAVQSKPRMPLPSVKDLIVAVYARYGGARWASTIATAGPEKGATIEIARVIRGIMIRLEFRAKQISRNILDYASQIKHEPAVVRLRLIRESAGSLVDELRDIAEIVAAVHETVKLSTSKMVLLLVGKTNAGAEGILDETVAHLNARLFPGVPRSS